MIKEHMQAIRQLEQNIADLEATISTLPENRIKFALEAELRILKRVATAYRDNSEDLYDSILDFSMRVAAS